MSYKEEIEDLEEHLVVYLKGLGGHPGRDTLLSKKIKNMEEQLELFKKAQAFDLIVAENKSTFSCGDFCDDVRHIINNYEIGVNRNE